MKIKLESGPVEDIDFSPVLAKYWVECKDQRTVQIFTQVGTLWVVEC